MDKDALKNVVNDPHFVQALKDFEKMGFIKVDKGNVKIIDQEGMQKWMENFGKWDEGQKP